jgi:hypothetical protein
MSFLGSYNKPKLTESKIVKKIINTQVIEITKEQQLFNYFINFLFKNYLAIIISTIIIFSLYWRYEDTKKKKQLYNNYEIDYY